MADQKDQKEEAVYTKSTAQLDLERRMKNGNMPDLLRRTDPQDVVAPYAVEDNNTSEYRGVSMEYMTYANETEAPLRADEGPENEAQKLQEAGIADVRKVPDWDSTPSSVVGVTSTPTVNTATSGEGLKANVVEAPADFQGTASQDVDYAGKPDTQTTTTAAPVKATKAATPAKSTHSK